MKWLLYIGLVLVALVVLVVIVGWLLPRDHKAVRRVSIRQPADALWAVMTDFAAAPSWRPEIKKCEPMPEVNGHPVWKETDDQGNEIRYETAEAEPSKRLVRRITDEKLPFGGRWIMELSPADGGTEVTITEEGFVSNPIWRFMSVVVIGHTTYLDKYLVNLGRKFGQEVKPSTPS